MGQTRNPAKSGRRSQPASAADYRADLGATARPVVAQASTRADGYTIPLHRHRRGQLLHAITGIMRIETANSVWIVPPARALWVPPELAHETSMRGRVEIRTLYVDPEHCGSLPAHAAVVEVSRLLRELILAALEEPPDYADDSRGATIAQLILTELEPPAAPEPDRADAARSARPARGPPAARQLRTRSRLRRLGRARRREPPHAWRACSAARPVMSFAEWRARLRTVDGMARIAGGASVGEAAASVGYASPSAFSAMVRRSLGKPLRELIRRAEAPASEAAG